MNYSLPYSHLASYSLYSTMRNIIAWNVRGPSGHLRNLEKRQLCAYEKLGLHSHADFSRLLDVRGGFPLGSLCQFLSYQ